MFEKQGTQKLSMDIKKWRKQIGGEARKKEEAVMDIKGGVGQTHIQHH